MSENKRDNGDAIIEFKNDELLIRFCPGCDSRQPCWRGRTSTGDILTVCEACHLVLRRETGVKGEPLEREVEPLMQFFAWEHLPDALQEISRPFQGLAVKMLNDLPRNPERTVMLRKLLEAKDCAVRARLSK